MIQRYYVDLGLPRGRISRPFIFPDFVDYVMKTEPRSMYSYIQFVATILNLL